MVLVLKKLDLDVRNRVVPAVLDVPFVLVVELFVEQNIQAVSVVLEREFPSRVIVKVLKLCPPSQ